MAEAMKAAGAVGYLNKASQMDQVCQAVRDAMARDKG
jgi:DNA-binding NarL/FixJ family response regulator